MEDLESWVDSPAFDANCKMTEVQDSSDDDDALDKAYAALLVAKKKEEGKREYTDATVWIGILADTLDYVRAL